MTDTADDLDHGRDDDRTESTKDPSQLTLPYMDSSIKWHGYRIKPAGYAAPGVLLIAISLAQYALTGNGHVVRLAVLTGLPLAFAGAVVATTTDYRITSPLDRVRGEIHHRRVQRALPTTHVDASSEPIHGYRRIFDSGVAEMTDGRLLAWLEIDGRNTERQTDQQANDMVMQATEAIRRETECERGETLEIFATTFDADVDELLASYEQQLSSGHFAGDEWVYARELIHDIRAYESHESDAWDARDVRTYAMTSVAPHELEAPVRSISGPRDAIRSMLEGMGLREPQPDRRRMRKKLNQRLGRLEAVANAIEGVSCERVGPAEHALLAGKYWSGVEHQFADDGVPTPANVSVWPDLQHTEHNQHNGHNAGDVDPERHRPAAVDKYLEQHALERAEQRVAGDDQGDEPLPLDAVADVDEITVGDVDAEISELVADPYRAGDPLEIFDDDETGRLASLLAKVREGLLHPTGDVDQDGSANAVQDLLAPGRFDVGETHVEAGKQYCKTFWLTGWPEEPNSNYLKELLTRRGLDFDLRLSADPLTKQDAIYLLERRVGNIAADIEDREDIEDLEGEIMSDDVEYYLAMYHLLKKNAVRAWQLNGYLTIRVGPTDALDVVDDEIEKGLDSAGDASMHVAKLRALDDAEHEVRQLLEQEPIGLSLIDSPDRADELFRSGFPASGDPYRERSTKDRTTLCLTGAIGAAFPWCSSTVQEPDAPEIGRSLETGRKIAASQFNRGGAPHRLTLADSGSGKTYSDGKQAIRWWLKNPDRTLILCDTMGGFEGHVRALNGNHVVVDGDTQINPLEIKAPPEHLRDAERDIDSFGMAFDAAVNWILGIVEDEGGDPDDFKPIVKDLLRETYRDAGIDPDDPATHTPSNSPTMGDFLDQLDRAFDDPVDFALRGHELEGDAIERELQQLSRRLSGFKQGAEYDNLLGESDVRIEPGTINYLDLSAIEGSGAADSSTMLELMLKSVYETVKVAPDETIFLIDEAHYLLHSARMRGWLQQSARHWRHYNAGLWFVTHRPDEFVSHESTDPDGHKDAIRGQCNIVTFYRLSDLTWDSAQRFGLNRNQWEYVTSGCVTGEAGVGYSTGILSLADEQGWSTFEVKAGPFEDSLLTWDPDTGDEPLEPYLRRYMSGEVPEPAPSRKQRETGDQPLQVAAAADGGARETVPICGAPTVDGGTCSNPALEGDSCWVDGHGDGGDA